MNITHAKKEEVKEESLRAIFNRQKELMEKYHDIELKSGLLQTEDCPINLDDKRGQSRIKDFAWRITEELGEAIDALENEEDEVHFKEEVIDGLHFLTEMTILSGYDLPSKYTLKKLMEESIDDNLTNHIYYHVELLGMMCNCLKNKPWKQTMMKTDKERFYSYLNDVWLNYIGILNSLHYTEEEILDLYLRKSQVNKFRQRSNY